MKQPQFKSSKPKKNHPWKQHQPGLFKSNGIDANRSEPYASGSMRKNRAR